MIKTIEQKPMATAQAAVGARAALGLTVVFLLGAAAWWVTKQVYGLALPFGIPGKALEYPLWGALAGLAGNLLVKALGIRDLIRPGVRTELFLKVGLVLMGASISLTKVVTVGGGALIQTVVLISSVFFFSWWLSGKFGLDDRLRAVMSTAISVCGVSAAIAAAGSVSAKKEQVTYITGLVIVVALPMMVLMPLLGGAIHLPEAVAGAWFGGNIDTTAAVIGAGTMYGKQAQEMATIVKSTQNTLIGLIAFLLALYFVSKNPGEKGKASPRMIWERFPKFVLGFLAASILFTLGLINGGPGTPIDAVKSWAFTLAFVCMGLDLSLSDFKAMGWKPVAVFLIVTIFNTAVALATSYTVFTYITPVR